MMSKQQVQGLAKRRNCPRCNLEKTLGNALCRLCRLKLPPHMRKPLEEIVSKDSWVVARAIRVAASYFDVHYRSIRYFGGGRIR
jgi:transcription elongation factor Elf1